MSNYQPIHGAGLGLRRTLLGPLANLKPDSVKFLEVAPENWIGVGGRYGKKFRALAEQYPITLHGLCLNIGGFVPLDTDFLDKLKLFMRELNISLYSDHLTYCGDTGQLYDLMPIPFTEEAVHHVAGRIKQVQETLERRIAIENASYYAAPMQQMSESEFINAVVAEADCDLLLDVNNIYVNSINHNYDPIDFLNKLPGERATYIHIAGHFNEDEDLKVDTHGADVIEPVWGLLQAAYKRFGVLPTLLERDFNIPPLPELLLEVEKIRVYQQQLSSAGLTGKDCG
ncbi:MAG: hypothetical protein ACI90U_002287 [Pseudomonadales bacterium]|jgi:uncharacterized protein (UPF0276 family)